MNRLIAVLVLLGLAFASHAQVLIGGGEGTGGDGGGSTTLILGVYACTFAAETTKTCTHNLDSDGAFVGAARPSSGSDVGGVIYTPIDENSGTVTFSQAFTGTVYIYGGLGSGIPAGTVSPSSIVPSGTDLWWLRSVSGVATWTALDASVVPFSISGTNFPGGSGVTHVRNALTWLMDNKASNALVLTGGVGIDTIGDLTGNRTVNLNISLLTEASSVNPAADYVVIYQPGIAGHRRATLNDLGITGTGSGVDVSLNTDPAETGITEINLINGGNLALAGNRTGNKLEVTMTPSPVVSYGVNAQTGTTYTVLDSDEGKLVTLSNGSAVAVTLPQAGASSEFLASWRATFKNLGAGTVTITPTTSTIDGSATSTLTTGQSMEVWSNGTNYFTTPGKSTSGGSSETRYNTERIKDSFLSGRNGNGVGGEVPWTFGGTHAFVPVAGAPGVKRLSTGASINTVAYMSSSDSSQTSFDIADVGEIHYRMRLTQVDADTTARIGLACQSHTVAQPTAGLWFERTGADTNWQRVARAASTETKQDTGVAASTSWAWFRIRPKGSGVIGFTINNGTETDISTGNVPTGGCNFWAMITNTAAADKSMDLDYFEAVFTVSR